MASAFRAMNAILGDVAAALEVPTDGLAFRGLLRRVLEEAATTGVPFGGGDDFRKQVERRTPK